MCRNTDLLYRLDSPGAKRKFQDISLYHSSSEEVLINELFSIVLTGQAAFKGLVFVSMNQILLESKVTSDGCSKIQELFS